MSTVGEDVQFKLMGKSGEENTQPTETREDSETIEAQPREEAEKGDDKHKIVYEKTLTVEALAGKLHKDMSKIIKKLMFIGVMATKNEDLSDDAIELIAEDYGFTVEKKKVIEETEFDLYRPVSDEKDLVERPAVVTIM